jgi:hypothetical protein
LAKEIKEGDPIYTLVVLHSNLFKLYTCLEMMDKKIDEEKIMMLLKIPPRAMKDWRGAKQKFASRLVRETMEVVAQAYQDQIHGNEGWQERVQVQLKKLE